MNFRFNPNSNSNILPTIQELVYGFDGIGLQELDKVQLLNRVDTKFVMPLQLLPKVLKALQAYYNVLEIKNTRLNQYESIYFDTPHLNLYHWHHNEWGNRFKLRYRKYVDSNLCFFEIKKKNNKGRTIKARVKTPEIDYDFDEKALDLLQKTLPEVNVQDFVPSIDILFTRLTLAEKDYVERATIDIGLTFKTKGQAKSFEQMVIVELKQARMSRQSPMVQVLKDHQILPYKISKYCLGIVSLYPNVKSNRFKKKIRKIEQLHNYSDIC